LNNFLLFFLGIIDDSSKVPMLSFFLICVRAPDGGNGNTVGGDAKFGVTLIRGREDRCTGVSTSDGCGKTWPTPNWAAWGSELGSTMTESSLTPPTVWARSVTVTESTRRFSSGGSTTRSGFVETGET